MMRGRIIVFFIILFSFFVGCSSKNKPAIRIGKITVTAKEFNKAFNNSSYAGQNKMKRKFLGRFISRKLILREAERTGLDKDPSFLDDVQRFWEQSLLKLTLSRKIKELSVRTKVSDEEIGDYYRKNKDKMFANKELPDVYSEIKWILLKKKQSQAIEDWIDSLRKNADIKIDYKQLGLER